MSPSEQVWNDQALEIQKIDIAVLVAALAAVVCVSAMLVLDGSTQGVVAALGAEHCTNLHTEAISLAEKRIVVVAGNGAKGPLRCPSKYDTITSMMMPVGGIKVIRILRLAIDIL